MLDSIWELAACAIGAIVVLAAMAMLKRFVFKATKDCVEFSGSRERPPRLGPSTNTDSIASAVGYAKVSGVPIEA